MNTGYTEDKQRSAIGGEDKNAYSVPTVVFPSSPIWTMSTSPKACHYWSYNRAITPNIGVDRIIRQLVRNIWKYGAEGRNKELGNRINPRNFFNFFFFFFSPWNSKWERNIIPGPCSGYFVILQIFQNFFSVLYRQILLHEN